MAHSSCVFQTTTGSRDRRKRRQDDLAGGVGQEDDQQNVDAGRFILGHGRVHVLAAVDRPAEADVGAGGQGGQHGAAQPLLALLPQARRKLLVQFERQGQQSNARSL